MNKITTCNVYAKDYKTVLAQVSSRCQSTGAAKAAGVKACKRAFVNNTNGLATGEFAWIEV